MTPPLVSAEWLKTAPGIFLLDASYYLPNEGKDPHVLYLAAHPPGARFFDIDAVSDHATTLPHMLPPPAAFAEAVAGLGVSNASHVVVYDQRGIFSSARLWWMFRVFGHDRVSVLDGGLPAWIATNGALERGAPAPAQPGDFTAVFRPEMVRDLEAMRRNLATRTALVLDARAAGRFNASVPEPRAGMRGGHIPSAVSLPFNEVLQNGFMRPAEELRALFAAKGVQPGTQTITSCGSGVTAAVLNLALVQAGLTEAALYDGSWSEWGARDDTPIEV